MFAEGFGRLRWPTNERRVELSWGPEATVASTAQLRNADSVTSDGGQSPKSQASGKPTKGKNEQKKTGLERRLNKNRGEQNEGLTGGVEPTWSEQQTSGALVNVRKDWRRSWGEDVTSNLILCFPRAGQNLTEEEGWTAQTKQVAVHL